MSLRLTKPRRVTIKICIDTSKTRRGSDEYGHSYRILAGFRIKYVSSFVIFGEDRNVCVKIFLKLGKNKKVGRQIYPIRGKKKKV